MTPTITYHVHSQKQRNYYHEILTNEILRDICVRVTGCQTYNKIEIPTNYNKGRLILIEYNNTRYYVTLSEQVINGRNSSLQSVPTAINLFYSDDYPNKELYYYFLPEIQGNPFTDYHLSYYRLLLTSGIEFLNFPAGLSVRPYSSIDEFIIERDDNRNSNRSNNSSYITKERGRIQIFAKVYGASKYESTLFGIVSSKLTLNSNEKVELYNINEQDLKRLPESSIKTLESLGNVEIIDTSYTLEKNRFVSDSSLFLRSPLYNFNLLQRLGHKKCVMCDCEIPEIIQGSHIFGVSMIKNTTMCDEDKFSHSINGHNGIWLCSNHHKLFDSHIISIRQDGKIGMRNDLSTSDKDFIHSITPHKVLSDSILSPQMIEYVNMRNSLIPNWDYRMLVG